MDPFYKLEIAGISGLQLKRMHARKKRTFFADNSDRNNILLAIHKTKRNETNCMRREKEWRKNIERDLNPKQCKKHKSDNDKPTLFIQTKTICMVIQLIESSVVDKAHKHTRTHYKYSTSDGDADGVELSGLTCVT